MNSQLLHMNMSKNAGEWSVKSTAMSDLFDRRRSVNWELRAVSRTQIEGIGLLDSIADILDWRKSFLDLGPEGSDCKYHHLSDVSKEVHAYIIGSRIIMPDEIIQYKIYDGPFTVSTIQKAHLRLLNAKISPFRMEDWSRPPMYLLNARMDDSVSNPILVDDVKTVQTMWVPSKIFVKIDSIFGSRTIKRFLEYRYLFENKDEMKALGAEICLSKAVQNTVNQAVCGKSESVIRY